MDTVRSTQRHRPATSSCRPVRKVVAASPGQGHHARLVAGQEYHVEVSILKQDYSDIPEMVANGTAGTDSDAWVSFQFNGKRSTSTPATSLSATSS